MNEIFNKKYIKSNTFFYVASILIVKKLNERFRIYINYRVFNTLTIKNRNISSLIKKTLIKLYIIKIFNKFDIITTFNEIRIKEENIKKIVFFTRYNLFEYVIMSFELCNVLNTFQIFINEILKKYLNDFYLIYLNDILIYSNNKEKYIKYIKKIFKKFQ